MKISVLFMSILFSSFIVFSGKSSEASKDLSGTVSVDGSSTVYPLTEAVAEEFRNVSPQVRVPIGVSGTGGGFKKFVAGEIDIVEASRRIKDSEKEKADKQKLSFIELPVAYDGISVVINPKNTWAKEMTVAELKKVWEPNSKVKTWKDVRSTWPDRPIKLYGPGPDSGTYDYFTKAIVGKEHSSRADYTKSEDDNMLVHGVSGDKDALGFFGFAYYKENQSKLNVIAINNGKATVTPTMETINNGTYAPLSRPVFIYVNKAALKRPEVISFVSFYLKNAKALAKQVGFVPLQDKEYSAGLAKVATPKPQQPVH